MTRIFPNLLNCISLKHLLPPTQFRTPTFLNTKYVRQNIFHIQFFSFSSISSGFKMLIMIIISSNANTQSPTFIFHLLIFSFYYIDIMFTLSTFHLLNTCRCNNSSTYKRLLFQFMYMFLDINFHIYMH